MANVSISSLISDLSTYKNNPFLMREVFFNALDKVYGGTIDIVDCSNPVVFMLEAITAGIAVNQDELSSTLRKTYPNLASNMEELYPHMSTSDQVGLWAKPASSWVYLTVRKSDIEENLVDVPNTANRKLTIARNSVFTAGGVSFSIQYPIDIVQLAHGGLTIRWDVTQTSPLKTITSNEIEFISFRATDGADYIRMKIDVEQFKTTTKVVSLTMTSGLKTDIALTDKPYAVRVWHKTNNVWVEINTTPSTYIYDPLNPTAVVQYLDGKVRVTVPVGYVATGVIGNQIRIVVYETKGVLDMSLSAYSPAEWTYEWLSIDDTDTSVFTAAMSNVVNAMAYSTDMVTGGSDPDSFEVIRERIINRSLGVQNIPITDVQLTTTLAEEGFTLVKDIDTITNRVYLATRSLPEPSDNTLVGSASSSMAMCSMSVKQAFSAAGGKKHTNQAAVLTSKTLYRFNNGVYSLLSDVELDALQAMTPSDLATHFETNSYAYSAFNYVLDASTSILDVRAYYMDAPLAVTKSYLANHEDTVISVSTAAGYTLTKTSTAYALDVITSSNDVYKDAADDDVAVWLSFIPPDESVRLHIPGTLIARTASTGERKYRFVLSTDFFVDASDRLYLTSTTLGGQATPSWCDLLQTFDIIYTAKGVYAPDSNSAFDNLIDISQLTLGYRGITHESIQLQMGLSLKNLWVQHRSTVSVQQYETYSTNIPLLYSSDVYDLDPVTNKPFSIVNGELVWRTKLHEAGEAVLDGSGDARYAHMAGDLVLDSSGNPIENSDYVPSLIRQVSIALIDGAYYFATDSQTLSYIKNAVASMVDWITDTLVDINTRVLERTSIYFHPSVDQGQISVITQDGLTVSIDAAQKFSVKVYVSAKTLADTQLCAAMKVSIVKAIKSELERSIVSMSNMTSEILALLSDHVFEVSVSGIADGQYSVVTTTSESDRLSLRKKLSALSDGTLVVENAVEVDFIALKTK